jgi:hypothetical protein
MIPHKSTLQLQIWGNIRLLGILNRLYKVGLVGTCSGLDYTINCKKTNVWDSANLLLSSYTETCHLKLTSNYQMCMTVRFKINIAIVCLPQWTTLVVLIMPKKTVSTGTLLQTLQVDFWSTIRSQIKTVPF